MKRDKSEQYCSAGANRLPIGFHLRVHVEEHNDNGMAGARSGLRCLHVLWSRLYCSARASQANIGRNGQPRRATRGTRLRRDACAVVP